MTEEDKVKVLYQNHSPNAKYDVYSNAIGFRITDDMKIGYRTLRYTGTCETTGSTEYCNTGMTFECGYTIEESYSDPICPFITQSDNCNDTWIQVDVVFKRNLELEDCEIFNNGGINDLVRVRVDKFQRYGTHKDGGIAPFGCNPVGVTPEVNPCKDQYPRFIEDAYFDFNCHGAYVHKWFEEKEYRLGTLTFYINGRRVHTVENYEEIIPRQLNTNKQTQMGVAYNMSWGGGALGLSSAMFSTSCDINNWTSFAPNSDQTLIRDNFGGTFIGGISQMMYYIKPLTPDEIYHNFLINRGRYSLIDCEECKNCDSGCVDCELPTGEVIVNMTYIPDAAFRAALTLEFGIVFDSNNKTETINISSITYLDLTGFMGNGLGITDLTGIESFSGLEELFFDNNNVTSIDLSGNLLLEELGCSGNQLTSLDVSNNTALIWLDCSNNNLTTLDLRNGNNTNMIPASKMITLNNLGLLIINVDDPAWSDANWPLSIGDANHDGVVNAGDLTLVNNNWLQTVPPWTNGDVNGDGIVNNADLSLVNNNWLNTAHVDAWTTFS